MKSKHHKVCWINPCSPNIFSVDSNGYVFIMEHLSPNVEAHNLSDKACDCSGCKPVKVRLSLDIVKEDV